MISFITFINLSLGLAKYEKGKFSVPWELSSEKINSQVAWLKKLTLAVTRQKLSGSSGLIAVKIRQVTSKMQLFMSDRLLNFDKPIA